MEGLLLTLGLAVVMLVAIVLLGRSWPRSSRIGGYRARRDGGAPTAGPPVREEDGVRWDWTGGDEEEPAPRDR